MSEEARYDVVKFGELVTSPDGAKMYDAMEIVAEDVTKQEADAIINGEGKTNG